MIRIFNLSYLTMKVKKKHQNNLNVIRVEIAFVVLLLSFENYSFNQI